MTPHARPSGPIDWDQWTAIGTLALATVTLVTLIASMISARNADSKVRAERQAAQLREQFAEAYAVQVIFGGKVTIVVNTSKYTITGIEGRMRLKDGTINEFATKERLLNLQALDAELRAGSSAAVESVSRPNLLTPYDTGLRLITSPASVSLAGGYPIVRWTDRWGTRWEHRLGDARIIEPSEPWLSP
jgi:hypothetical protein